MGRGPFSGHENLAVEATFRHLRFHLNVDLCAVRLINDTGKTAQPGEVGEIRISNLHNRAMVLLNYHLGDRGVLTTTPCSCGRTLPVLARLEGRSSEILRLADGRTLSALLLEIFCWDLSQPALQIQIVQPTQGQLRWRLVPRAEMDRIHITQQLAARSREFLGTGVGIEVEFVDRIPVTPQGKFLKVVQQ